MSNALQIYTPDVDFLKKIELERTRSLELARQGIEALQLSYTLAHEAVGEDTALLFVFPKVNTRAKACELLEDWRKRIDRGIWRRVMRHGNLWTLLGGKQREEFEDQLLDNPPHATKETICSTCNTLGANAAKYIGETTLDLFGRLHPRYVTNRKSKFGKKIIIQNFGLWTRRNSKFERLLTDLSQVLHYANGQLPPQHNEGLYQAWIQSRKEYSKDFEHTYVRAKVFKNGNVHVWIDLQALENLNALLAQNLPKGLSAHVG